MPRRCLSMSSIAIITARGGSKRIPRKNIKDFCGKPIIAYSIEAALESNLFDEVMVSTDDAEIAEIAKSFGANVPFLRSAETSDDYATTADVLREVLNKYAASGKVFDIMCCLYPTAPFVSSSELIEAWRMIEDGAPSVIPVTSFDFPPQRGFDLLPDDTIRYTYPEYATTRSQDLPSVVHDCGRFYMMKTDAYLANNSVLVNGCKALFIAPALVQDIDTLQDWEMAEFKYRFQEGRALTDEAS